MAHQTLFQKFAKGLCGVCSSHPIHSPPRCQSTFLKSKLDITFLLRIILKSTSMAQEALYYLIFSYLWVALSSASTPTISQSFGITYISHALLYFRAFHMSYSLGSANPNSSAISEMTPPFRHLNHCSPPSKPILT